MSYTNSAKKCFYGIHVLQDTQNGEENCYVFANQREAFDMLRTLTKGRLKEFNRYKDAVNFSKTGFVNLSLNPYTTPQFFVQPNTSANHEFLLHGPKRRELIKFRKLIETGKLDDVKETIWSNPRYLIGEGGTPTILKESTRYNALHVATLSKSSKLCKLILNTLSDPFYIYMLIGRNNSQFCDEVSGILLDFYLNMPEKGRLETPLHLAVKFGYVDVVKVLLSYAQCLYRTNSEGNYPKDITCSRCSDVKHISDSEDGVFNQIVQLLESRFQS